MRKHDFLMSGSQTIAFLMLSAGSLLSAQTFGPITGYNQDIIANGTGNASQSTTIGLDEANTRALLSSDFKADSSSPAPAYSLPADGQIPSLINPSVVYRLADYSANNALYLTPDYVIGSANSQNEGTLSFQASDVATLYILSSAAGGGSSNIPYTAQINFSDGTSQTTTVQAKDWYGNSGFAVKGIGRINISNNNVEGDSENPRLYEDAIPIATANQSKTITGVTFTFNGDSSAAYANEIRLAILSVSASSQAVTQNLTVNTYSGGPAVITTSNGELSLMAQLNGNYTDDVTWTVIPGTGNASIDQYAKVTALADGTVKVMATLNSDPAVSGSLEITISGQQPGYCQAYFVNGCSYLYIDKVSTTGATGNLNNISSGCSNSNSQAGYADFSNLTLTASKNSTVTMDLGFSTDTAYLSAWIDWNGDRIFSDDERIYESQNSESTSTTISFTVPDNAVTGTVLMRLKAVNGWVGSGACGYNSMGEVEDYSVEIQEVNLATNEAVKAEDMLGIYPNPATDKVYIKTREKIESFELYTMSGAIVKKGTAVESIDTSNLPSGAYILKVILKNKGAVVKKIIRK
ncbi:GEVED domain-containing protein [Chryseobacterium sp. MYb264]|uniref:GEVED domain-containing protein n=1 Tax=Chryseobacterium sp. MYb264 TaxID=2745153 RepID=UPI002E0FF1AB|nr:GEVED domain-containing protein [Chryseobacterium sp. MYb264]